MGLEVAGMTWIKSPESPGLPFQGGPGVVEPLAGEGIACSRPDATAERPLLLREAGVQLGLDAALTRAGPPAFSAAPHHPQEESVCP